MSAAWLELGQMQRVYPGESVCGDGVFVRSNELETVVALADGLGHGPEAHHAANVFADCVRASSGSAGELLRAAHRALSHTRGAAAMILRFERAERSLEVAGVGNVECHALSSAPIRPVSSPGVVGHNVRRINEARYSVSSGDWFALVSDGVGSRVSFETYASLPPQRAAELIVQNHSRNDDSSCVVIRVL